ncbi:unnamed protein product [Menidia menidia]|uniref:(Atlantic silverside) hypothetical protein n=1 Tax=Menidia menidia TaxID=238744 RepID=A0A8S4BIG8_9TELE|nr:unnamed protein product [Menidia menidia]
MAPVAPPSRDYRRRSSPGGENPPSWFGRNINGTGYRTEGWGGNGGRTRRRHELRQTFKTSSVWRSLLSDPQPDADDGATAPERPPSSADGAPNRSRRKTVNKNKGGQSDPVWIRGDPAEGGGVGEEEEGSRGGGMF